MPAPSTNVHTRINARASITETRAFWGELAIMPADTLPLVLASVIVEGAALWDWALAHRYRDYCEARGIWYTAYPDGARCAFLRRFTQATRTLAQRLADTYTIYL